MGAVFAVTLLTGGGDPPDLRAAGPVYWDYPEHVAFTEFELMGVAHDRYGRLTVGLAVQELLPERPDVVWQAIGDGKGGIFAATGHGGEIWHVDRKGEALLHATLAEPEIFSLLRHDDYLFAGGGPDGLLYRVGPDGEVEVWADLPEGYIWALEAGPQGKIYLATGSPAAVYLVKGRLDVILLTKLPAVNALDLALPAEEELLVTTQGPGLIYRIDLRHPRHPQVLFEAPQEEIRHLTAGPDGAWYALALSPAEENGNGGVSPAGNQGQGNAHGQQLGLGNGPELQPEPTTLYRLGSDGLVSLVWTGDANLLAVVHSETWGWLGAGMLNRRQGQAALLALGEHTGTRTLATWEAGDVLDLMVQRDRDGRESVVASLAHLGGLIRLVGGSAEQAIAISPPLDGEQPIRWGRLRWDGEEPDQGRLRWSVRGGARSQPDETWSEWSESWSERDHPLDLTPSRFLQWRVEFSGVANHGAVALVTVSGYEPNGPPRIFMFVLQPEGEIAMGGLMGREENITETFPGGLKAEYSRASRLDRRAGLFRAAPARPLRTFTWLAHDSNSDQLVFQLDYQRVGEETWRPVRSETRELLASWDTATVPDGWYVVRLTASDRPDNTRAEALTASRLSAPLQVDHTAPEIRKFAVSRTAEGITVDFEARDAGSPLAEAWFELPDGSVERLDPVDGVCDSQRERFAAELTFPDPDGPALPAPWRVRVEIADRLGNVAAEESEVK